VPTRIEDEDTENEPHILNWVPPQGGEEMSLAQSPSLIELSSKRYPFDCPPARSWRAWLKRWKLSQDAVSEEKIDEYWSPVRADRALAWDFYVELQTRITTQDIGDNEGDDKTALESVAKLFDYLRKFSHRHGFDSANAATLIVRFLNEKVRGFTAKWHKRSLDENWGKEVENPSKIEFREELRKIQAELGTLALALSAIVGVEL